MIGGGTYPQLGEAVKTEECIELLAEVTGRPVEWVRRCSTAFKLHIRTAVLLCYGYPSVDVFSTSVPIISGAPEIYDREGV